MAFFNDYKIKKLEKLKTFVSKGVKTLEIEECRSRLLELIKEKALKVGKFVLSSGKESD